MQKRGLAPTPSVRQQTKRNLGGSSLPLFPPLELMARSFLSFMPDHSLLAAASPSTLRCAALASAPQERFGEGGEQRCHGNALERGGRAALPQVHRNVRERGGENIIVKGTPQVRGGRGGSNVATRMFRTGGESNVARGRNREKDEEEDEVEKEDCLQPSSRNPHLRLHSKTVEPSFQ